MKRILSLLVWMILGGATLFGQDIDPRTTYPIDSCIYFMQPGVYKVRSVGTLPNGNLGVSVNFQSVGNADLIFMGRGNFLIDPNDLPVGLTLSVDDTGNMLVGVPDSPPGGGDWPDGPLPVPIVINGFLNKVGATLFDPPLAITMQVPLITIMDNTQ